MWVLFSWSGAEVFVWYLSAFAVDAIHVTPVVQGRQIQLQSGGSSMEVLHWRPPWCLRGREVVDDSRVGGSVSAARKSLDIQRRNQSSPCLDVPYSECRRDSWWLGTCKAVRTMGLINFCILVSPTLLMCMFTRWMRLHKWRLFECMLITAGPIYTGLIHSETPWEPGLEVN